MTKVEIIEFWLKSAKENLITAKAMLDSKRWNFAMFMCQQTMEAILKAAYIKKTGERPPHIHKLPQLSDMSQIKLPAELDKNLLETDAHYIKARYFTDRFNKNIYNKGSSEKLICHCERSEAI